MKNLQIFLLLLTVCCAAACTNDQPVLKLGSGNDVKITLNVLNPKGISKIEFATRKEKHTVLARELTNYKTIEFGFEGKGEGTFWVLVYTKSDTLKAEHYVEGGYHVKMNCDAKQIKTIDHTGIMGY